MPHSCNECSLEFDNKVLHDMHWKKCIKTVTFVTHTGEQITITRHQNGTFVCYCSHPKCPKEKGFVTVDALQKHMKTLKTTWLGPEKKASAEGEAESSGRAGQAPAFEIDISNTQMSAGTIHTPKEEVAMASPNSPSPSSPMAMQVPSLMANQAESSSAAAGIQPHFLRHPYLDGLNLVVNAELSFLTCQLRKEGVAPTAGRAHLVNKHAELLPTFDQECFDSILAQLHMAASLPNLAGPRSIVHGLMVFDAIACKFCTFVYTKQKNMREHHMKKHPDMPIPQHWRSCKAQRIKPEGAGTVRQLWEVTTQARAGEDSRERALADKLLGELEEQLKTVRVPKDNWLVSPWLLTTRWHEWAWWLRKPTEELCAMVALPRPSLPEEEHYKTLVETIELYFEEAVTMTDSTDELVLQRLNSPDPVKGHQHDGTLKKYMHPVWTTPWSKSKYHIVPDPMESCLALLTLNRDGSFKSTKEVTTLIAKFEYCMHLTFLREIRARASAGNVEVDEEAACNALQPWFTEKNYSTFARLRSLQHRASAISFSTMALPSIWWMDTEAWSTLSFKGNHVAFTDVCEIFKDVEEALVATWENKVLKGLELRADYKQVVDDPSNKDVGYSFLFDPRNSCFQDRAHLVRAVVRGHGPFANFLVQREDELVWNRAALHGWLQDYAELQKLLLMRAEMLSGAPSRGMELTAMLYRNTQARDTWNLMVFGKHVTLLGQYSKMSALTCQDKLIPHALDALTGDILIQNLALARPFAEIAVRICFADEEVSQLYHDHLFVNFDRLFTSNDLSMVMAKYSLPRVKFAMMINPWWHIQTAWKCKFKCAMDDVDALQAGHSRATENRVYGLSMHSLEGAAEDILPLFLQASTGWQEQCQVMPSGSGLPYPWAQSHLFKAKPPATASSAMRNLSTDCAADKDAMVENIANRVVERLTPMLTDLMQALTTAGGHSEPSAKAKGKQKETGDEDASAHGANHQRVTPPPDSSAWEQDWSSDDGAASQQSMPLPLPLPPSPPPPPPPQDLSILALQKMQALLQRDNISWSSPQQKEAMMKILG
ncbi:hypothetical protein EDC04DRAFT_2614980 [Pisolithus marmoratus]|nr:hypothetical protein EDC04DRAFT_2614980 [Pisolithus marmoratus]